MRILPIRVFTLVVACAVTTVTASGCASAPIDMLRASAQDTDISQPQAELRTSAVELTELVSQNGWRLTPTAGEQARSFVGRLIGGEAEDDIADDPLDAYVSQATPSGLVDDLDTMIQLTRAVITNVRAAAAVPTGGIVSGLERDIALTEEALGAVRGAHVFLQAADARIGGSQEAEARLAVLAQAKAELAEAADGLAQRRWSNTGALLAG